MISLKKLFGSTFIVFLITPLCPKLNYSQTCELRLVLEVCTVCACVDVRAVGFWHPECWTGGSVMLRSRWPGTVDTVTLDNHCQFIFEAPAKPKMLMAFAS